jgi:predicted ATPase/DNA-binding SARP family transcriptional activator/Tfp pilus assembly protein PilF
MNQLHVLGALDLRDAADCALRSVLAQPKRVALLSWLCIEGGLHRRDTLLALFWPESEESRARHSLNQALYTLRRSLGAEAIVGRGADEVGVEPRRLWCDAAAFADALAEGRPADALALYRDDLLKGFFLDDAPEFERWLASARLRLRASAAEAAWQMARGEEEANNSAGVAYWARRAVAYAPDDEARFREVLKALARTGQPGLACREFDAFATRLRDEYDLEPEPTTQALVAEMRTQLQTTSLLPSLAEGRPSSYVPVQPTTGELGGANLRDAAGEDMTLPSPPVTTGVLIPFVGREAELRRLSDLLADPAVRLITIAGPPGAGKTRLALHAASMAGDSFPDGVVFVPLVALDESARVLSEVVAALSLRPDDAPAERQLLSHLRDRRVLLLLDNMDHLLAGATALAELLGASPGTKMLVTSREALNVRGEWLLPLAGMHVETDPASESFASSESVRLFVEAAHRTQPDFALGPGERRWLAELLQLVEGLPLGIELAASWTRALELPQIVEELRSSRLALANPMRDAPGRHASLEAALAYSWQTLSPDQAEALNALSVFRGGFTRDAAQEVAGASLVMVRAFLDKSLLQRLDGGRYGMLEVIREYAARRLAGNSMAAAAARDRHRDHFARLLRHRDCGLTADNGVAAEMEADIHNLRGAWDRAAETAAVTVLEAMSEPLFVLFDRRGDYEDAACAFGRAVAGCPEFRPALRARLLARQGALSLRAGRLDMAQALLTEALDLARAAGEVTESAFILDRLGVALYQLGHFEEARARQEESLVLRRGIGDRAGVATSLNNLGSLAYAMGAYADAVQRFTESLRLYDELIDEPGAILSLHNLGCTELMLGRTDDASARFEAALQRAQATGSGELVARSLCNLANASHALGRSEDARDGFLEALSAAGDDASPLTLEILLGLAGPLARLGDEELAAGIAGFVAGHPATEEGRRHAAARLLEGLRTRLPADELQGSATRWRASSLTAVVEEIRRAISRGNSLDLLPTADHF